MKNLLFKTLAVFAILAASFSMTSCNEGGDDDDSDINPTPDMTVKNVTINYSINLADTYYKYFDINIEYINNDGQIVNEALTENMQYSFSASYDETPDNIVCKIVATPKAELPSIESGNEYICDASIVVNIKGYNKDGIENEDFAYRGSFSAAGYNSAKEWTNYTSRVHTFMNLNYPKGSANPVTE